MTTNADTNNTIFSNSKLSIYNTTTTYKCQVINFHVSIQNYICRYVCTTSYKIPMLDE